MAPVGSLGTLAGALTCLLVDGARNHDKYEHQNLDHFLHEIQVEVEARSYFTPGSTVMAPSVFQCYIVIECWELLFLCKKGPNGSLSLNPISRLV